MEAALYPDSEFLSEGYLYFCAKEPTSGELAFARTLEEHEANVAQYPPAVGGLRPPAGAGFRLAHGRGHPVGLTPRRRAQKLPRRGRGSFFLPAFFRQAPSQAFPAHPSAAPPSPGRA